MGWAEQLRSARAYSGAGPNVRAVRSRYVGCVGRCSTLRRCAIAVSGVWRLLPFRALVPLFAKTRTVTCAHPERLRYLAVENEGGVLPEIRWFSSNGCALGLTLRSSAGAGNEKPQVNVLCLLSNDSSMSSAGCHVDENHPISGILRGSNCITARGAKAILLQQRGA